MQPDVLLAVLKIHRHIHTCALNSRTHICTANTLGSVYLSRIHDKRVGDHFVLVVIASTDDAVVVWLCSCIVVCVRRIESERASEPGSERRMSEFANNGYIYRLSERTVRIFSPFAERIPSLNP
jgi:hypothetical protein